MQAIEVPEQFVQTAKDWHGGQVTRLYEVASTGKIRVRMLIALWDEITDEYLDADPQDKIELLRFKRWVNDRKTQFEEELLEILEEDDL